jgi:hypothetical protein
MAPTAGWYVFGPLIGAAVLGVLGAIAWRLGLQWLERAGDPLAEGLAIFGEADDYGLLCPAAVTDDPGVADAVRGLLAAAGIRATSAVRRDGRVCVLVFAEHVEEARRLVGDTPAL